MPYLVLTNRHSVGKENYMVMPFEMPISLIVLHFLFKHGSTLFRYCYVKNRGQPAIVAKIYLQNFQAPRAGML